MKTFQKIVVGLLLVAMSAIANAYPIKIFPDHHEVYLPQSIGDVAITAIIAQSGTLGVGVNSISQGVWDPVIGAWNIPSTALKDRGVFYSFIDTNGNVYRLDTHTYIVQAVSGHVDITDVMQDESGGTVSYNFKTFGKLRPTVSYISTATANLLRVNMGTSIFYGAKPNTLYSPKIRRLTASQIHHFELRGSILYTALPRLDLRGNMIASFNNVPRGEEGTLWVVTNDNPAQEYPFDSGIWTTGSGVSPLFRINE